MSKKKVNATQPALGVYRIAQFADIDYVVDVQNGSKETNARVWLYGDNGTQAQKILLTKGYLNNDNYRRMQFQVSGKCAYVPHNSGSETILMQYDTSGGTDLDWDLIEKTDHTIIINGITYNTYKVAWRDNGVLVLDNSTGAIAEGNKLQVYTNNDTVAQRWVLIKDSYINEKWKVPSATLSGTLEVERNTFENRTLKITNGTQFQMRTRYRTLNHDTNNWSDWTLWYSPTDATTDEGWGNAWTANAYQSQTIRIEATNETSGYDAVQYEAESRVFGTYNGQVAHGYSTTKTITTKQKLEAEFTSCDMTAGGMLLTYETNAYRTCDAMQIEFSDIMQGSNVVWKGQSIIKDTTSSGTILIPYNELLYWPNEGSQIKFAVTFRPISNYIGTVETFKELTVAYESGDLSPQITIVKKGRYDIELTISEADGKPYNDESVSFVYEHDGKMVVHQLTGDNHKYILPIPFNTDYKIFVTLEQKTGETIVDWGAKYETYRSEYIKNLVLNTANHEIEFEMFNTDLKSQIAHSKDLGYEESKLEGTQYSSISYSSVQTSNWTIKGAVYNKDDSSIVESALNDGYCLFRDMRGRYCYCAVLSYNIQTVGKALYSVDIDLKEIRNEIDIAVPY